jgi:phospholipase/lecithinase/hemolysin
MIQGLIARKTQEEPMNKLVIVILLSVLLTACTVASPPAPTIMPTATPSPNPTQTPLPPPTNTPVPPPTDTPIPGIDHVYAFGDSLSDIGHDLKIAKDLAAQGEFDPNIVRICETYYWKGRDSNGPAAVEVLADKLKAELTDYAVGGATTGYDNTNGDLWKNTGLMAQIDQFENELNGEQADPNALYFLHIGANDFIKNIIFENSHSMSETVKIADQAITNINTAVGRLAKLGARRFMVVNSADISKMPDVNSMNYQTEASAFQKRINSLLPGEMEKLAKQLMIDMNFFDYTTLSDRMHNNPGEFGLTNRSERCLVVQDINTVEVCPNPDQYFYWDGLHPTRRVHQIMGEAMADQLSK